jgi:AraC-like DNA-binding protein
MRINGVGLNAEAGRTIALIGPDSTWELSVAPGAEPRSSDARAWTCLASPVWRSEPGPAVNPGLMLVSEHGPFTRYEEQLTTIYHELLDSRGQFRRGLCSSLFHSLAAEIVLNAWDLARPSYTRNDILRLCGEIRAQPERRFRLAELAEMASLSPRQLRRVFVSETGMTPKEFEIESRMAHAEFLLANQGLKVYEVAQACGYSDPFLFSRQFSRLRGRSPRSFRPGQPRSTSGSPIARPD